MTVEQIPADIKVKMTDVWHRSFNASGCNPKCHLCHKLIKIGQYFKLSTVFQAAPDTNCLHWYKDLTELQIKAIKGEEITDEYLGYLKKDFFFEEKFKEKGGLKGVIKLSQPIQKEVMLCSGCTPAMYTKQQLDILEGRIIERDKPRGGCFRINGKIVV